MLTDVDSSAYSVLAEVNSSAYLVLAEMEARRAAAHSSRQWPSCRAYRRTAGFSDPKPSSSSKGDIREPCTSSARRARTCSRAYTAVRRCYAVSVSVHRVRDVFSFKLSGFFLDSLEGSKL